MAFFDDFLTGFATTTTETMQRKSEQRSKEALMDREYGHRTDLARQESIMRLNVEDELAKRKAEREAAKSKADYERALQMRDDLFSTPPIAESTPSTGGVAPFNSTTAPTQASDPNLDEYNRQSNLAVGMTELAGDNEYMKTFGKTAGMRADVAKTNAEWTRTAKKQAREEGRQPVLSADNVDVAKTFSEVEAKRFMAATNGEYIQSEYLPEQKSLSNYKDNKKDLDLEQKSSGQAIRIIDVIMDDTKDANGMSNRSSTETVLDAKTLVLNKNIFLDKNSTPEQRMDALEANANILSDYTEDTQEKLFGTLFTDEEYNDLQDFIQNYRSEDSAFKDTEEESSGGELIDPEATPIETPDTPEPPKEISPEEARKELARRQKAKK